MSSSLRSRSSTSKKREGGNSPSREFQAIEILFGAQRAALVAEVDRPALEKRFTQIVNSLSADQQQVLWERFNLKGRNKGPISDHQVIAAKLDRGPRQVGWSLTSAENKLREHLEKSFPVLKAPSRTPQNS
jgi:hypothetical protein